MKKLTISQIVAALMFLVSIVVPSVVKAYSDAHVPLSPLVISLVGAFTTIVSGLCRSLLTSFSGTETGLTTGPDVKARRAAESGPQAGGQGSEKLGAAPAPGTDGPENQGMEEHPMPPYEDAPQ